MFHKYRDLVKLYQLIFPCGIFTHIGDMLIKGYADIVTIILMWYNHCEGQSMSDLADWDAIDWALVQSRVTQHQHRIYKASLKKERGKMYRLQKLLSRSINAKLIAVRCVTTENRRKSTHGVNNVVITSSHEKLELANRLGLSGKALKIYRVFINKSGKKKKPPLGIPIIEDRANQILAKIALEPEWEARFESNSYGFRPGRFAQDAMEAIFLVLRQGKRYVLNADISNYFDSIDHESLLEKLNTYPEMKLQIKRWLEAGIIHQDAERNTSFEKSIADTTFQRSIISPFLVNIALHGMENAIDSKFSTTRLKASIIRYGGNFVIIHKDSEAMERIREFSLNWLSSIGLTLNPTKIRFMASTEGFEFLGFHFTHVMKNGSLKTKITPSRASQARLLLNVRTQVQTLKGVSTYALIQRLSPILVEWGNYFRTCECNEIFKRMDHHIYQQIRSWVFRRHPTWGRQKIKEKYFPEGRIWKYENRSYSNNWVLSETLTSSTGKTDTRYLMKLAWMSSKKHVKL